MSGFEAVILACDQFEQSIDYCKTGAVTCDQTPPLTKQCLLLMNQLKLMSSKKMLLKAELLKESAMEEEAEDEEAGLYDLSRILDVHSRWSQALKAQALSQAAVDVHRDQNYEQLLFLVKKMREMCSNHESQHQINKEITSATLEMLAARSRYQETVDRYSKMKNEHRPQNKSNKTDEMDVRIGILLKKIEVMRVIQRKLMVSCEKYDWCTDNAKLLDKLSALRDPPLTLDSFK